MISDILAAAPVVLEWHSWKRLWAPITALAVLVGLLVDFRDATSRIGDMLPRALAVIEALLSVLILGGIAAAGVWLVGTVVETESERRMAFRRAVTTTIETGYMKLPAACEPETLDDETHNPARLKADARDHVNQVIPLLSGDHPGVCTTDDDSLHAWFAVFQQLRMEPGLAKLAIQEADAT